MWIRMIDNSDPVNPRVFEYKEGVLSNCDYRIHNNGRVSITLHKEGYTPDSNLESSMIVLMTKDMFDVEMYSGSVIVKSIKCKVNSYNMGTGENGNLRERAELGVLVEGIDFNFVEPKVREVIYDVKAKSLTVLVDNLIQEESGVFYFDTTKMSLYGSRLNTDSVIKTAQRGAFSIQLSEADSLSVEQARQLGAVATFNAVAGWNSKRSNNATSPVKTINFENTIQQVNESGSTEGLSN